MITLKTPAEIDAMAGAGQVVARALRALAEHAKDGVTLTELDEVAAQVIRDHGATSSFDGYHPRWAPSPFQGVTCLSVNDVVVHGMPGPRILRAGDVLSVDCGAVLDGWNGDAAITVAIGDVPDSTRRLVESTREALYAGIAQCRPGNKLGDIAAAIEAVANRDGYGILENHGGHGIGTAMHEEPHVSNRGRAGRGLKMREGLVLALEPMFHAGGGDGYRTLEDGWSIATDDGSLAAHWEHSVAVTADGPRILTES
ncbi:MAG: type I methionyl aminopeptidase [Candidatus Nanopelagicales bacterium]